MHVSGMNGAQGIKNRRGELQRVLSREESYVDGKLSRAAFISIAILTFITFVGNFTQLQLSSALPIIVSEFHISAPCWHGWGQTSYGCWSGACSKLPAQA